MIDTRSPTSFCANLGAVEDRSVNRDELSVEITVPLSPLAEIM